MPTESQRTTWIIAVEVLGAKFALPLNVAVIEWEPELRLFVPHVATPSVNASVANSLVPSLKVTVPVGTPESEVTRAANVTCWPSVDGFRFETTEVVVGAGVTVCTSGAEVLAAQVLLPL
jgi:hypothetical protein